MSLDTSKLKNIRRDGDRFIAQCPACATEGRDSKGDHLVVFDDGKFGCVMHEGPEGHEHRSKIFGLVGKRCGSEMRSSTKPSESPRIKPWSGPKQSLPVSITASLRDADFMQVKTSRDGR